MILLSKINDFKTLILNTGKLKIVTNINTVDINVNIAVNIYIGSCKVLTKSSKQIKKRS